MEEELAPWWETFQHVSDIMREDMVDAQRKEGPGRAGPGKARRVKRSDTDHPANQPAEGAQGAQGAQPDLRFRDDDGSVNDDADDDHSMAREGEDSERQAGAEGEKGATAPKKRRRRRRKTGGAAAAPDADSGE